MCCKDVRVSIGIGKFGRPVAWGELFWAGEQKLTAKPRHTWILLVHENTVQRLQEAGFCPRLDTIWKYNDVYTYHLPVSPSWVLQSSNVSGGLKINAKGRSMPWRTEV
jgi:hypothetical protein